MTTTRWAAVLALALVGALVTSMVAAIPAQAATVYELEGEWDDDTPDTVQTGDSIAATWWANVNDDAAAPGNEPVDNVTITMTVVGGVFDEIPPACLTHEDDPSLDPESAIIDDGATLVCNGGTFDEGTALRLNASVTVTALDGETISMSATVADQQAELPEIDVQNDFLMDIHWEENRGGVPNNGDSRDVSFNWTLFHGAFSADGPASQTYTLSVSNSVGATMQVGPEACSPFTTGSATGHPWSGGDHPTEQLAPFVADCTLERINNSTYELTLSGIDYSHAQVPTEDSADGPLPTSPVAVASGLVQIRVITESNSGQVTMDSSAPTYPSPSGALSEDDPENNTSTVSWTSGVYSSGWLPGYTGSSAGQWTDTYRVSPGSEVRSGVGVNYRNADETATVGGVCQILDTDHVTYTGHDIVDAHNNTVELDVPVEYLVSATPLADPNGLEPCGDDTLNWVPEPPADLSLVRAVRSQYDIADVGTDTWVNLRVLQEVDEGAGADQDIWTWSGQRSTQGSADWIYSGRSMDPDDVTSFGTLTPDARYPFATQGRDVLRVSSVTPSVDKTVDPSVVDPGGSATFTVTYSADGVGDIVETVDDYEIVDTLPAGMTYVAGSSSVGSEPEIDGSTLTWTLDGVPTNEDQTLTYSVAIADDVDSGDRLENSVTGTVDGVTSDAATAAVTVNTAGATSIVKTADQELIPNVSGDGVGEGSWTVDVVSEDPSAQVFTDTIDILPYNGDGRGTDMAGTYQLSGPVLVSMGATVYYTTADPATLSDDPADVANGAAGDPAGNTVGWSTTFDADATAVRVITDELEPRGAFNFTVPIVTEGMDSGDTLVNRAQGRAENTRLVMRTSAETSIATYYSANLKKYVQDVDGVWHDANDPVTYPEFHIGDTVRYRVVVTNTGQGTLTDIVVSDDLQPELGAFTIDSLAPGAEESHEYEIVLEEPVGEDAVVNTACAEAAIPDDSVDENGDPLAPDINCDPAGFTPRGDTEHSKELVSATPIGGGQWEIVYGITVESIETPATDYSLIDELHFTDQATITSAEVTASPADVVLSDPAWDGQENLTITGYAEIEGMDNPDYEPHVYEVTVVADVPLQLDGAGSGADDPTACGEDGDATDRAFTNTSELTKSNGETEDDWACAELPSIDIDKSITDGPVPNGDGTWTVSYDVVATNDGAADGDYDVTDRMSAGGDLDVVSTAIVGTPDGVTANAGWTGLGAEGAAENVIAEGVSLPGGGVHTYQVEVVLGMAEGIEGPPNVDECPAEPGGEGGGLANTAEIVHNDLTEADEECTSVAAIVIEKSISSGPVPNGDGTFTITYDLVAENIGGAAGDYDLADRLQYGEGIEITSAAIITAPEGVTTNADWSGQGEVDAAENVVATGVTLEMDGVHTYQVQVTVQLDEDTIDASVLECPEPGSGESGGLANSTELDHNGIVDEDEVCASLPLIDIAKTISEGPVANGDGTWTISYELVATNTGGAAGDYDLTDRLLYGEGIVVEEAGVVVMPDGVETNAGWTGQGDVGTPENVISTDVTLAEESAHTYQVDVTVSLDLATVTPEALECPEPGSGQSGGLANSTELTHNGEDRDDDVCAPLPLITIIKSLAGPVMPVEDQDGVYDVTYELLVTNSGEGAGVYDLSDTLAPGEGIEVVGVQEVTTDAPEAVLNDGFDGVEDTVIVTDQPIAGAVEGPVEHTYEVSVRYSADLFDVEVPTDGMCTTADGGPVPGALNNEATVEWNGIEDEDEECILPGKPTLDKELVTATPVGGGQWEVVYDLTVGNVGGEATSYDLDDEFLFAEEVTVAGVQVAGPAGVTLEDAFDGDGNTRIATDVTIAGLDADDYAPHVYTVTVVADVPLQFDEPDADGTGSPACTEPGGSNSLEQGLNNAATLTDENGNESTDTDCAALPSIEIAKQVSGDPVVDANGEWTVTYEITATNDGAAEGLYTLTDQLRFGAGITITSATVTSTPEGVSASPSWTGQGDEGAAANVVATDVALGADVTHTYQVQVTSTLDEDQTNASTFSCEDGDSDGNTGFTNVAGLNHNGLSDQANACATPDEPPDLPATGATVGWVAAAAALLLLLGLATVVITRRRSSRLESGDQA
ncbi:DUF7507 domain-containing protein [Ruania halotolerans]|uniref:DUF7507 domain-containing protein n=1 Tax=Ruania halotolerans TaxID=2897773 RepID=UPI001E569392|nr:LPXTG cell wall anchor domain-containing protein [Ruania halotolerans]UFU07581.1 DUF11 domain-containing protein [Ruania halotolerans]